MINNQGISVIICCYNSALRLPETLKYLAAQQFTVDIPWEVVIVDNNSTDNTKEVANKEWNKYNVPFALTMVDQPLKGQAMARIKGIETAKFDHIVYCDDDNWLFPDYLERAHKILSSNEKIAACGGYGIPVFENNERPGWFDRYQGSYAVGPQYLEDGIISNNFLFGAGFTFKKHVHLQLDELGIEKLLSGRVGSKLTSGDDYEMSLHYKILGYELYYDSNLKYYHYIPSSRLDRDYILRLFKAFGEASSITIFYEYAIRNNKVLFSDFYKQVIKTFYKTVMSYIVYHNFDKAIHTSFSKSKLEYLIKNKKLIFKLIRDMNQIKHRQLKGKALQAGGTTRQF